MVFGMVMEVELVIIKDLHMVKEEKIGIEIGTMEYLETFKEEVMMMVLEMV